MLASFNMQEWFSDAQLDKLSDIFIVIGEVLFASVIVPVFFGLDTAKMHVLISALFLTTIFWCGSIIVAKGGR